MSTKTPQSTNPLILDDARFFWIEEGVEVIPYAYAKKHRLIPIFEEGDHIGVAILSGADFEAIEDLKFFLKKPIRFYTASEKKIDQMIEDCYHKNHANNVDELQEDSQVLKEGYDLLDQKKSEGVIKVLDGIFVEAITQKASDIHFEPQEETLLVRFRIDGVLQQRRVIPKKTQDELVARIKVLSKLDIAETRLPQDGRMKLFFGERQIDFRVSTVPVACGERVVLRILDKKNIVFGLDSIGMPKDVLFSMRTLLQKTQGIILVTGPTGSGKTSTLYSALKELDADAVNIMTIEDPVEFKLPHMAQIQVNPKIDLTFSAGLKHILRQDPDVIMVGEIRDKETAEIAIQASLTGHLVLSTLHTNDAISAPTRLIDMGIEPFLIQSSLVAVLAQRLVRVVCPHCKEAYSPTMEEFEELNLKPDELKNFHRAVGCKECFHLGYKGRIGIYELLTLTSEMKSIFLTDVDKHEKLMTARKGGFKTLKEQGATLVLQGISTFEEIIRVTGKGNT